MKKITLLLLLLPSCYDAFTQNKNTASVAKPKLIIGIVVDQMRWDYLYRYAEKYGQTGFKRLQSGYNCENTHIPYVPTITGPGHTCVYTGSVPAIHGIIANEWYDRNEKKMVNCIEDTTVKTIGSASDEGKASPVRLLTTTITDEHRLATNFHSKVIGIAAKDRGAILPAGHTANAAYWFDHKTGNWITSSYYMDALPKWVDDFNAQKLPATYAAGKWNTLLDIHQYTESTADDEPYERVSKGEDKPVFPHMMADAVAKDPGALIGTPWGNTITLDFAKAVVSNEHMGKGSYTDFLTISCSSTDYVGHQYGPNSVEAEDCYLRLDRDLGDFLSYLDKEIGAGNYLIFLTADHGVSHSVGFNQEHKIPSGAIPADTMLKKCNAYLLAKYGTDSLIEKYNSMQIWLHYDNIKRHHLDAGIIRRDLVQYLLTVKGVAEALNLPELSIAVLPQMYKEMFINGYNQKRSGDIQVVYEPGYLEGYAKGTTHSAVYSYDTHIPLLWYGWGVRAGYNYSQTYMTDIAATLAGLLHIQEPSGCVGKPIEWLMK